MPTLCLGLESNMDGANAVCRICGTSGPGLVHMYSAEGKTRQILAKIRYCFSKEVLCVSPTDGLPKELCLDCQSGLDNSFSNARKIHQFQNVLKEQSALRILEQSEHDSGRVNRAKNAPQDDFDVDTLTSPDSENLVLGQDSVVPTSSAPVLIAGSVTRKRPRELKLPNIFDEECPRKSISSNQELTTPEMPTQSLADTHPRPDPPPYSIPDSLTFPHFSQSLQGQCNEPESGCLEFEASTKHSVQSRLGASIGFDKLSNGTPSSQKNLVSSCGSFRPVAHSRTTVSASALGSHPIPSATISQSRIANVPPIIATVSPTSPGNFHIRPGFDPRTSPSSLGGSGLNLKAMPLANPNPLALGNVNYLQPKLAANVTLPDGSRIHVPIVNGSQLPDLQFLQAHLKNSEILKVEPSPRPEEEVMRPISLLSLGSGSFKCTQCNISFKNADARTMVKHCLTAHGTEKTLFGCPVCTQRCDSPQKIMEHMKNSHSSALANPPPPPVKQECSVCHEAYTTRAAMKIHMQNAHFATGLHECPTCKRMFSSRATLKRHQLTHAGARPHSCSICGSHFTQKSALAAHMKTHHANQTDSLSASTTDEN